MSFTELHFHLLPGVDDGPDTMEAAIALARLAAAEGTRTITATPHVMPGIVTDPTTLPERVSEVNARLHRAGIPVRVLCGGELAHTMVTQLTQSELDVIAHGPRERRWLLLEAPLGGLVPGFSEAACELRARGFGILVAHPERSLAVSPEHWPTIQAELEQGSAMQINAWSLTGVNGEEARRQALRVIRRSPVVVVASDAHGPERPPSLHAAFRELRSLGISRPEWFADTTPRSLLERGLPMHAAAAAA